MNDRKEVQCLDDSLPKESLLGLEECKDQITKFVRLKSVIEQNCKDTEATQKRFFSDLNSIDTLFDSPHIKDAHDWALAHHAQNNIFTEHVFGGKLHLNESDPLPCADNYSITFQTFPSVATITNNITYMISSATSYIIAFTKFAMDLETNSFQDISPKSGQKLSITQYYNFFSTARVSQKVDTKIIDTQFFADKFADFIIVMYRGFMFKVKVLDRNTTQRTIESPQMIMQSLYWIISWVQKQPSETQIPLTVLTTAGRQEIEDIKQHLIGLGDQNAVNLKLINECLFMVTLDDSSELMECKDGKVTQHRHTFNYSKHIWYEKSISLVVTSSGLCGINFEHSFSDSGPAHKMASTVYQNALKLYQSEVSHGAQPTSDNVELFQWILDKHIQDSLVNTYQQFQAKVESKQAIDFAVNGIGATKCKQLGVSPDAFFQVSLAWALSKYHNRIPLNLETIDSRMFRNSRLFVVPTLTQELVEFLSYSSDDTNEKKELLKKAIIAHKELTQQSMDKQGFYLFFSLFLLNELGLRDQPPHPFTQSELYKHLYSFDCVSSNVGDFIGVDEVLSGFPAQDEEGMLVVGYIVKQDSVFVTVTCNDKSKSLESLSILLKDCLLESLQLLSK